MVTLRDLLPLIKWNDVRIINAENGEEEICSIGKEYLKDILSEKFLGLTVDYIDVDETILETINIYVKMEGN